MPLLIIFSAIGSALKAASLKRCFCRIFAMGENHSSSTVPEVNI
jgi:hypothetical protein